MGWIAVALFLVAVFAVVSTSSQRSSWSRRQSRLETAFFRARGQRMTSNGIRGERF
ncbi:MAG: hypothetical protein JNL56_04605 [Alphaproteobacteria bacterium]|nr:hypothetical protein [Alphaproteobacteria bacterium]